MAKINWTLKNKKVSELKENPKNPRSLTKKGLEDLEKSMVKFGVAEPLVVNTDDMICGGHGRKKVLEKLNIKEVDCYYPNRKLTPKEFDELNIRLNKNIAGEFDMDILANEFDVPDLLDWGFKPYELGVDDNEIDYKEEWQGMPEFDQDDKTALQSIIVHFKTRKNVEKFAKLINQKITDRTKYLWFPYMKVEKTTDKRYKDES